VAVTRASRETKSSHFGMAITKFAMISAANQKLKTRTHTKKMPVIFVDGPAIHQVHTL
jgi:hypothetical protein